jgi:hypothetical protein
LIREKYSSKVQILFRQQIQPWHPSSTLVHEAGVAVLKLQPAKFWDFSKVGLHSSSSILCLLGMHFKANRNAGTLRRRPILLRRERRP